MFSDAKNYMKRRIRKLEYKNIKLPSEYEKVLSEYKRVRDDLDMISAIIKSLSHYEFGGQFFRKFASVSNVVASKSRISALKREDIYTDAARVGEHMSESIESPSLNSVSRAFADAWMKVSESKVRMNARLNDVQSSVGGLKRTSKGIDERRGRVFALRYDLEEAAQNGESMDIHKKEEYERDSESVLKEMKEFLGESGLAGIMKRVCSIYKEFSADSSEFLSKMK
ncbi:hypothetical protein PAEPH01_1121 [Pancytospora epiphaga]|nr:hypothetical protein PAEPH01_1121 [Pancytospora epiphaga]